MSFQEFCESHRFSFHRMFKTAMPRLVCTASITATMCQAAMPPAMCAKALGPLAARLPVSSVAQREGAPDEGKQPNQAHKGEDGRQQRVIAGALRAITEACRRRPCPGAEQAFARGHEPRGQGRHGRCRSGSSMPSPRRRARETCPPRSSATAASPARRRTAPARSKAPRPAAVIRVQDRGPARSLPGQDRCVQPPPAP